MVKMSVLADCLKNIVNAEKAGKRQVCDKFKQPLSLLVEEALSRILINGRFCSKDQNSPLSAT